MIDWSALLPQADSGGAQVDLGAGGGASADVPLPVKRRLARVLAGMFMPAPSAGVGVTQPQVPDEAVYAGPEDFAARRSPEMSEILSVPDFSPQSNPSLEQIRTQPNFSPEADPLLALILAPVSAYHRAALRRMLSFGVHRRSL